MTATGDACRFRLARKAGKAGNRRCLDDVAVHPAPAQLWVGLACAASGAYLAAPPINLKDYDDGVHLAKNVLITKTEVLLRRAAPPLHGWWRSNSRMP